MQKEPPPFVWAVPDEKNILTCQYAAIAGTSIADLLSLGNFLIVRDFHSSLRSVPIAYYIARPH